MSVLAPGSLLGRYQIIEEVGQGGMSVVYRARDEELQRDVAIKVLHDFLMTRPEARERFHREAMAVAKLRHPNIIEIHDYSGTEAEFCYIVTELVEGTSMAPPQNAGPLEPPELGLIALRPIADALAHAHQEGVIHRDLKPENVLVGLDGRLKLTDFGIARTVDHQNMTVTGTLLGSPAYMAPEYIEGKAIDPRVDIFAFGAMLYQTLTGTLPFEGPTPASLLLSITTGDYIAPNERNRSIHGDIVRLINRCLARNPDDRFPTMAAVRDRIDELLDRIGVPDGGRDLLQEVICAPRIAAGKLQAELGDRYLALAQTALQEGLRNRALEDLDRVLSIDPTNAEVHRILALIHRSRRLRRALRGLAGALAVGVVLVALGGLWRALPETPDPVTVAPSPAAAPAPPPPPRSSQRNVTVLLDGEGELFIDGAGRPRRGNTATALLLPGVHRFELRTPAGLPLGEVTRTIPGEGPIPPVSIHSTAPSPPPKEARAAPPKKAPPSRVKRRPVQFRTAGAWVNVEVNGRQVAKEKLGLFSVLLPYGKHELRFTNDKARPKKLTLTVSDTEPPQVIPIRLQPRQGILRITGAPDGAVVTVAGKKRLLTPLTRDDPILVPLEAGKGSTTYEVVIRLGKREIRRQVVFRPAETYELAVDSQAL